MNLDKLSPAPWEAVVSGVFGVFIPRGPRSDHRSNAIADAEFIALARNAFDVMIRRGWSAVKSDKRWQVRVSKAGSIEANDPFTALVEADRWFKENVEQNKEMVSHE